MQCDAKVRDESKEFKACLTGVSAEGRRKFEEQRHLEQEQDKRPHGYTLLYVINGQFADAKDPILQERLQTVKTVKKVTFFSGPAASALYGARGYSGVVAVSTKK